MKKLLIFLFCFTSAMAASGVASGQLGGGGRSSQHPLKGGSQQSVISGLVGQQNAYLTIVFTREATRKHKVSLTEWATELEEVRSCIQRGETESPAMVPRCGECHLDGAAALMASQLAYLGVTDIKFGFFGKKAAVTYYFNLEHVCVEPGYMSNVFLGGFKVYMQPTKFSDCGTLSFRPAIVSRIIEGEPGFLNRLRLAM